MILRRFKLVIFLFYGVTQNARRVLNWDFSLILVPNLRKPHKRNLSHFKILQFFSILITG